MPFDRTRRRLLLACAGSLTGLAGCTSVVEQFARGDPTPERTEPRSQSTRSPTPGSGGTADAADGVATTTVTETAGSTVGTSESDATGTRSEVTRTPASTDDVDVETPEVTFADAPVPDDPDEHRYATMGSLDATATATVFGSWKCTYTRAFVVSQLDDVVDRFVRPGDLAIRFRAMAYRSDEPFLGPDAPRAAEGGLSVWNVDPESYWAYFASVFANQPPARREWATTDNLLEFAATAGVEDVHRVEQDVADDAYADAIRSTSEDAAAVDVFSVPRVVVDGTVTAPTLDPEATVEQLERAVER